MKRIFPAILKEKRALLMMSQLEFSDLLQQKSQHFTHLDAVTISRWERGITTPPQIKQYALFNALGLDILNEFLYKINHSDYNFTEMDEDKIKSDQQCYFLHNDYTITKLDSNSPDYHKWDNSINRFEKFNHYNKENKIKLFAIDDNNQIGGHCVYIENYISSSNTYKVIYITSFFGISNKIKEGLLYTLLTKLMSNEEVSGIVFSHSHVELIKSVNKCAHLDIDNLSNTFEFEDNKNRVYQLTKTDILTNQVLFEKYLRFNHKYNHCIEK